MTVDRLLALGRDTTLIKPWTHKRGEPMTPTYPEMHCTVLESATLESGDENRVSWGDLSRKVPVKADTRIDGEQVSCIVLIRKDLLTDKGTSPVDEARPLATEVFEGWIAGR